MLTIRRLNPTTDTPLYEAAWQWNADAPRWVRDCAKVFEAADEAAYLAEATDPARVDIGVFTPEFTGMITLILRGKGVYEAYLAAKRHSPLDLLGQAVLDVYHTLTSYNMRQTFVWIAARNRAILNLCANVGFAPTGLEMWKGSSHGQPIRWRQLAIYGKTD
jgi:hypothetical protein